MAFLCPITPLVVTREQGDSAVESGPGYVEGVLAWKGAPPALSPSVNRGEMLQCSVLIFAVGRCFNAVVKGLVHAGQLGFFGTGGGLSSRPESGPARSHSIG
jgi:hypothetical protein